MNLQQKKVPGLSLRELNKGKARARQCYSLNKCCFLEAVSFCFVAALLVSNRPSCRCAAKTSASRITSSSSNQAAFSAASCSSVASSHSFLQPFAAPFLLSGLFSRTARLLHRFFQRHVTFACAFCFHSATRLFAAFFALSRSNSKLPHAAS